jgi:excisionase family DNA binding protein
MSIDREAISNGHGGRRNGNGAVEHLLTLLDVAECLGVSPRTIRRLVNGHRITCVRIGRTLRFDPADVSRFVAARKE